MGKQPPPFASSASSSSDRDYQAESDYRTLGDADRVSQDPLRKKAALQHGKSQLDVYSRLSGKPAFPPKSPAKKRGFTPAMRSLSGGGR